MEKNNKEEFNEFPEDIDLQNCIKIIETNQLGLLIQTRQIFTNSIRQACTICEKNVKLDFSDKLWYDNRLIIAKELLERFGEIKVIMNGNSSEYQVGKSISDPSILPSEIAAVIIEFWK
jgi:hypothetical protein